MENSGVRENFSYMKKVLLLFFCLIVSGCSINSGRPETKEVTTLELPEVTTITKQVEIPEIKPTSAPSEYVLKDGYSWHGDKQITNQPIEKMATMISGTAQYEFDIWNKTVESDGSVRAYVRALGGCEGCVWIVPYYFLIDPKTDTVELKKIKNDYSFIFHTKDPLYILSPQGKQIAVIDYASTDQEKIVRAETIDLVDLTTEARTKIFDIKEEETVLNCNTNNPFFPCEPRPDAIYFKTESTGQETLTVVPKPYDPIPFLIKQPDLFTDICVTKDGCNGLKMFTPTDNWGYYKNNGFLLMDTVRNLIVDDQVASSKYAYTFMLYPLDFNKDGRDEYLLYYHDRNNGLPTMLGDNIKIYRFDGAKWVVDYEKNVGLIDGAADGYTLMDKDTFFTEVRYAGEQKLPLAIIKLEVHDSYKEQHYEYLRLFWNGQKVIEEPFEL